MPSFGRSVSRVVEIQRLLGNRAVSRLVERSGGGLRAPWASDHRSPEDVGDRPLQRYTVVPTSKQKPGYWEGEHFPLRVADDGTMAVKHINGAPSNTDAYQSFYATPGVIQASSQALAVAGSAFTIAQGTDTMVGKAPGTRGAPQTTLYKAETSNQDLEPEGRGDQTFNVCSGNLSNFLGILRRLQTGDEGLERRRDLILKLQGTLDHEKRSVVIGHDPGLAMAEARRISMGKETNSEAREAYNALEESMRKQISVQYGIDEHAVPDVGEGWGIMTGGKGGGMGHFAPVIAKSGEDRVTLENDVGQTAGKTRWGSLPGQETNPHWYFRMFGPVKKHWYGKEDQTFWGEAKKHESGEYGDKPLVATLGSQAREEDD